MFLVAIPLLFSCGRRNEHAKNNIYFPKTEVKCTKQISKENLWVFLLAGQSNMAGRALVEPEDTLPNSRILTINKNRELVEAKEPLHFYEPSMTGLDCGLSFGKQLLKYCPDSVYILIIPTAVGGSSINQWLGDSTHRGVRLFSNFEELADFGSKIGLVKGILWHQGEEDADSLRSIQYGRRLQLIMNMLRDAAGDRKLPVGIGEIGVFSNDSRYQKAINDTIRQFRQTDENAILVSSSSFNHIGDFVHFDSPSERKMGEMLADSMARLIFPLR